MDNFLNTEIKKDVCVIKLSFNEINLSEREQLKGQLLKVINGFTKFVLDFSKVGFLSSLVIATLVSFSKEVEKNNGKLKLSGLSEDARDVLSLTKLDKLFEIYNTARGAIDSF